MSSREGIGFYSLPFEVADVLWALTHMGLDGIAMLRFPKLLDDLAEALQQPDLQDVLRTGSPPDKIPKKARFEQNKSQECIRNSYRDITEMFKL